MPVAIDVYSPGQAEIARLYDLYRNCALGKKYYAHKLKWYKRCNVGMDLVVAFASSTAFAGLAFTQTPLGKNLFSLVFSLSVVVSVVRPVLKISEGIDRYSKLHYGYAQLFLTIEEWLVQVRRTGSVKTEHFKLSSEIFEKYRNLELQDDPAQNQRLLRKFQSRVNAEIPAETLWLPGE